MKKLVVAGVARPWLREQRVLNHLVIQQRKLDQDLLGAHRIGDLDVDPHETPRVERDPELTQIERLLLLGVEAELDHRHATRRRTVLCCSVHAWPRNVANRAEP